MIDRGKVQKIARKFGVNVHQAKEIKKGFYLIKLRNGKQYAIKPVSNVSHTKWADRTLIKIRRSGFSRIAWRRPHLKEEKKPYIIYNDTLYVMSPWIHGRHPNPKSMKEMRACGIALAKFHQAGLKINVPKAGKENAIGTWGKELAKKHSLLASRINHPKKHGYNDTIASFLRKHGQEMLQYAKQREQNKTSADCSGLTPNTGCGTKNHAFSEKIRSVQPVKINSMPPVFLNCFISDSTCRRSTSQLRPETNCTACFLNSSIAACLVPASDATLIE